MKIPASVVLAPIAWVAAFLVCQPAWSVPAADDDVHRIKVTLDPGSGMVALRIVGNRPTQPLGYLHVRNVTTGKGYVLQDQAPASFDEEVYVGALPVGVYELRQFENLFGGGMVSATLRVDLNGAPGPFQVSAQHLTDLGSLVILRPLFPSREFRVRLEPSELAITRLAPLIDTPIRDALLAQPLTWQLTANQLAAYRLSAAERQLTQDLDRDGLLTPDGALIFGEAFGQLVVRDETGHWHAQQLPTIGPITSIAQSKQGVVAAGSTEGEVWVRVKDGSPWEARPLPRPDAVARFLAFDDTGRLLAVAETSAKLHVYRMEPESLVWNDLHQFAITSLPAGYGVLFNGASLRNDHLRISVLNGGILHGGPYILSLSLSDGHADAVGVGGVRRVRVMSDGTFYGMSSGSPLTEALKVSDDGVKWESRGSPKWSMDVVLRTPDEGYLLRNDSSLRPVIGAKQSLWKTVDGGRTWQQWSEVPAWCSKIVLLASPAEMLLITNDGLTLLTKDGGKTWQEERSLRNW